MDIGLHTHRSSEDEPSAIPTWRGLNAHLGRTQGEVGIIGRRSVRVSEARDLHGKYPLTIFCVPRFIHANNFHDA